MQNSDCVPPGTPSHRQLQARSHRGVSTKCDMLGCPSGNLSNRTLSPQHSGSSRIRMLRGATRLQTGANRDGVCHTGLSTDYRMYSRVRYAVTEPFPSRKFRIVKTADFIRGVERTFSRLRST